MWQCAELTGSYPEPMQSVRMPILVQADTASAATAAHTPGKARIIGLYPCIWRTHMKCRRHVVSTWEAGFDLEFPLLPQRTRAHPRGCGVEAGVAGLCGLC